MRTIYGVVVVGAGIVAGTMLAQTGIGENMVAATGPAATRGRAGTRMAAEMVEMPKDLAERIDKGIELLEAGKHKDFIETLASPAMLKKLKEKEKDNMDKFIAEFGTGKSPELLKMLKAAKGNKVGLTKDGTRARLQLEEGKFGPTMDKVDGVWYLGN